MILYESLGIPSWSKILGIAGSFFDLKEWNIQRLIASNTHI